jgi:hypothetical protein
LGIAGFILSSSISTPLAGAFLDISTLSTCATINQYKVIVALTMDCNKIASGRLCLDVTSPKVCTITGRVIPETACSYRY